MIGRDGVVAGGGERRQHLAPAVGELGEAVQQQHGRPVFSVVTRLEHVNVEAVDAPQDARTNARGQDGGGERFHCVGSVA